MPKRLKPIIPSARATRIVATVGPSTSSVTLLRRMIQAGVDVFRFNMSHGTHASHAAAMARVRSAARSLDRVVGILVDLQGPKVRIVPSADGALLPLKRGTVLRLANQGGASRVDRIVVDYRGFVADLRVGDSVLLDDGRMLLRVLERARGELLTKVVRGGLLKSRAGVNVPARALRVPVPTAKDRRDARFAVREGADFVALSFVRSAEDLRALRQLLRTAPGRPRLSELPLVVAKLEKPSALVHLDEILDESDVVMVARGDLGVELSLEKVPYWQKEILARARNRGVLTITATQMLESMVEHATPTRAEVSDVANAIYDGTDAVMLSGETANGAYPLEAVRMLARIAREAERSSVTNRLDARRSERPEAAAAMAEAACDLARRIEARALVVFTRSGATVRWLVRGRPTAPVLALTPRESTRRRLTLAWNTRSLLTPRARSTDQMMRDGLGLLRRSGLVRRGDLVVVLAGALHLPEATHLLRLVRMSSVATSAGRDGAESGHARRRPTRRGG